MKRLIAIAVGSALLLSSPALSWADDEGEAECPEGKVKTCFMDGHDPSCVCLDPASSTDEVAPQGPNPGDEALEYQGDGGEEG